MSNRHRKLRMEQMEARQMMAGDVAASVQNGNLILSEAFGQAGRDNSVQISQIDAGKIRVEGTLASDGLNSKINGSAFQDFDVTGGLFVKFGAGNDTVNFSNGTGWRIDFSQIQIDVAASAASRVTTTSLTGMSPVMPPDNDIVFLGNFHTVGSVSVNTGVGNDTVTVLNGLVGEPGMTPANLSINTGAGVDLVRVKSDDTHQTFITGTLDVQAFSSLAEADQDFVFLEKFGVQGDLHVRTGGGNDTIAMTNLGATKLDFDAGAGADSAVLSGVSAIDSIMAHLGEGDDTLSTEGLYTKNLQLFGDGGIDSLSKKADTFVGARTQSGWEYINGLPELLQAGAVLSR
jgi:hypothetical protein